MRWGPTPPTRCRSGTGLILPAREGTVNVGVPAVIRLSKLVLWLVVVVAGGGITAAYSGAAAPIVAPSSLPGAPVYAFPAVAAILVGGLAASASLDRRAWRRMGEKAGLSPESAGLFENPSDGTRELLPAPVLSGTVRGRPVRVRTYSTSSGGSSNRTTTVVEADLERPVEWAAMLARESDGGVASIPDLGSMEVTAVDGEFSVVGDLPHSVAEELLDQRVRDALSVVDGGVAVGDVADAAVDAIRASLEGGDTSLLGDLADGVLGLVDDGDDGPSERVVHRSEGLLLDGEKLERRLDAVVAVAESVDDSQTWG